MALKSLLWRSLYSRWRTPDGPRTPGYTLLVPVPGDLPVFTELALAVCRQMDPADRVETLVIPDAPHPATTAAVERARPGWPGPLRLVNLRRRDRLVTRLLGPQRRPHAYHWLQLVNGAEQTRSVYALLHDADLFVADPGFHRRQYEEAANRHLACLGVNPVWDDWFAKHGYHVAATWELLFDVDWLRSFPPHLHLGHDNELDGEHHLFDNTIYPQCRTPADRIAVRPAQGGLVHFNYVICTYRHFQASRSFEDAHFRILLVRLLIDAFDQTGWAYEAPPADELAKGLTEPGRRVTYRGPEAAKNYPEFRAKLDELLASGLLDERQAETVRAGVQPFDRAFG